jgi:acetyltransferase-like isoleucine patch superfamily enzyme
MKVWRVRSAAVVAPWNDPVGDVRVLGVPLAERQERVLHALGLSFAGEVDEPGADDALYWDADVDVSLAAMRAFLRLPPGRMALVERPPRRGDLEVEAIGPTLEGVPTRIVGVRRGDAPAIVPPRGIGGVARMPGPFRAEVPYWLTARSAVTIRHWTHLLRANLCALAAEIDAEVLRKPWRAAWAFLRHGARWSAVGKGAKVHPTARLEGCVVGAGAEIGAFSVLRGCVVGAGAVVEDHVTARGSVIDPGGHLGNYCLLNLCVVGASSSISHIGAQGSVLGRDSFLATFATPQDLNLSGNVRVAWDGRLVDTGGPFCGCAIGHRVRIGAGVTLAAGRSVPNDVTIVPAAGTVLARIPDVLAPGVYAMGDGALVRMR